VVQTMSLLATTTIEVHFLHVDLVKEGNGPSIPGRILWLAIWIVDLFLKNHYQFKIPKLIPKIQLKFKTKYGTLKIIENPKTQFPKPYEWSVLELCADVK